MIYRQIIGNRKIEYEGTPKEIEELLKLLPVCIPLKDDEDKVSN